MTVSWGEGARAPDYFEPLILDGKWDFVNPDDRALSDNYYGWVQEVYEHLGFVFAVSSPCPVQVQTTWSMI